MFYGDATHYPPMHYSFWARPSSEEPPVVLLKRWRWTIIQANASLTQRFSYDQHMLSSKESLKILFPREQNRTEQILVSLKPHQPCFGSSDMAATTFAVKYRHASMDDFAPFWTSNTLIKVLDLRLSSLTVPNHAHIDSSSNYPQKESACYSYSKAISVATSEEQPTRR